MIIDKTSKTFQLVNLFRKSRYDDNKSEEEKEESKTESKDQQKLDQSNSELKSLVAHEGMNQVFSFDKPVNELKKLIFKISDGDFENQNQWK